MPEDWIAWAGGNKPAKVIGDIEVQYRDGQTMAGYSGSFFWHHEAASTDIVAYRRICRDN